MHAVALFADATCCDEIRAKRVVLRQICREIHFLPLELLAKLLFARKAKLSQMPATDEVNLTVVWAIIHSVWMSLEASLHTARVHDRVCPIMTQ